MAKLPRSPIAQDVRNNYTPVREARASGADPVGQALEGAGNAGFEIASRMADAKIAADAAEASIRLRSRLDEESRAIENDMEGDPAAFETRFRERAAAVVNEEAGRMSSPAMRKAFALKAMEQTETYSIGMRDTTRRRQVEGVKAQTMKVGAEYETLAKDPSKPRELLEEAKDDYLALINQQQKAGIYTPDVAEAARIAATEVYQAGVSTRHLSNVDDMLDAGRYGEAEEYFKASYGEIDPAVREKAEDVLETKKREGVAVQTADQLWNDAGGNYDAFIAETRKIENIDERLAVESRGAMLKNQRDAGKSEKQAADLESGMSFVVSGQKPPASWFRDADPDAVYTVQERLRAREEQALRVAGMTAEQRALAGQVSTSNYRILKAQMARDPELANKGMDAVLADPQMKALWEDMQPDEQGQFFLDVEGARKTGGVPTDSVSKAYKSVVARSGIYVLNEYGSGKFDKDFKGAGEGDPGVKRVSSKRKKSDTALEYEGELMRLVEEEVQRIGGAEIDQTRADQLVALAAAKAGEKKDGTTKYPIPADTVRGIVSTDAKRAILDFRAGNPDLWRDTAAAVRAKYPEASDAVVLEEARRIMAYRDAERIAGNLRGMFGGSEED